MARHKIAVIGVGKIALDQHLPVLDASPDFELTATVSTRSVGHRGLPVFTTAAALYEAMPEVKAVAICTPPGVRHTLAAEALAHGKDVLLEKPPTPTLTEFYDLIGRARAQGRVLFQTWHSQYNEAVERTRALLADSGVVEVRIDWRESVRKWHPGQDWVWAPGGFGVCDPGINALSILTRILPFPVFVESARLTYPANRQTPVDVEIVFKSANAQQPRLSAHFNWLQVNGEIWSIAIETMSGDRLLLEKGGTVLRVNGAIAVAAPSQEYQRIYAQFAVLLAERRSLVDDTPLRLIADAFLIGARETGGPFEW